MKPGAVEHAGVSQGWTRERGLPHITSELNPQLLTLSPFLLVYSLLLRHCAGESMSLNLGPVFVASQIIEGGTPFHTHVQIVLKNFAKILKDNVVFYFTNK